MTINSAWWTPELRPELSRGDILDRVYFSSLILPIEYLQFAQISGGKDAWTKSANPVVHKRSGKAHALSELHLFSAIVLSHDCEIDKPNKNSRVLLAPIASIDRLTESGRANVLQQKLHRKMPLPDVPALGTCFVEFRSVASFPTVDIKEMRRIASMTDSARERLEASIAVFFLRKEILPNQY